MDDIEKILESLEDPNLDPEVRNLLLMQCYFLAQTFIYLQLAWDSIPFVRENLETIQAMLNEAL